MGPNVVVKAISPKQREMTKVKEKGIGKTHIYSDSYAIRKDNYKWEEANSRSYWQGTENGKL